MAKKTIITETDVRDDIVAHLKKIKRPLSWLSNLDPHKNTDIHYSTIYSVFVKKDFALSQANLTKINKLLETEFTLS